MPLMPGKRGTGICPCAVTSSMAGGSRNQSRWAMRCFTASREVFEPSTASRIFMRAFYDLVYLRPACSSTSSFPPTARRSPRTVFADYEKAAKAHAKRALALIEREAAKAGVRGASRVVEEMQPWQGILKAARKGKCDAIVMASHGRGGLGGLILGSQTARVLAHSKLPVLVIR